jgi:hypothetical protein
VLVKAVAAMFVPLVVRTPKALPVDFDELTVHRINIIEPDGTPRLIISDKAEFAGEFCHPHIFFHGHHPKNVIERKDLTIRRILPVRDEHRTTVTAILVFRKWKGCHYARKI